MRRRGEGGRPGIKIGHFRNFPGGPVIKTPIFHCREYGFDPGWGVKIPEASWQKKSKHNNKCDSFEKEQNTEFSIIQILLWLSI